MHNFKVILSEEGMRLDQWIKARFPHLPASVFFGIFKKKQVKVNGKRYEAKDRLYEGDEITLYLKELEVSAPTDQLNELILDNSDGLLVIQKPAGLAVHPGAGQALGQTLVELLEKKFPENPPKLVHRLDQGTSGVLLMAFDEAKLKSALNALRSHQLTKRYYALVFGNPGAQGEIDESLNFQGGRDGKMQVGRGKTALTLWWNRELFNHTLLGEISLLEVEPWTGRMHQIRTHLASQGFPIVGDPRYGDFTKNTEFKKALQFKRMFLHAYRLNWPLVKEWIVPLSSELDGCLNRLRDHKDS